MKVVVDTNVLISGIFFTGPPHRLLLAWSERRFDLVVSPEILSEYFNVSSELSSKYPGIDKEEDFGLVIGKFTTKAQRHKEGRDKDFELRIANWGKKEISDCMMMVILRRIAPRRDNRLSRMGSYALILLS